MMKTTTSKGIPDREACLKILEDYGTPDHVISHCKAVAAVGYRIASALNEAGHDLDLEMVLAGGLLHDMARVEDNHWDVAADYCIGQGWPELAEVIRAHMFYDQFNSLEHLNETDILCLADRTVLEDRYVGIDRRIDQIIEKARRNGHEEYVPHILKRKEETKALLKKMEEKLGLPLEELLCGINDETPYAQAP